MMIETHVQCFMERVGKFNYEKFAFFIIVQFVFQVSSVARIGDFIENCERNVKMIIVSKYNEKKTKSRTRIVYTLDSNKINFPLMNFLEIIEKLQNSLERDRF